MKCQHNDCFTCPYPDCIADSTTEAKGIEKKKTPRPKKNQNKKKIAKRDIKAVVEKEIKNTQKKYNREYYLTHKVEIAIKRHEAYLRNKDKVKAYQKQYYELHREDICERAKEKRRLERTWTLA